MKISLVIPCYHSQHTLPRVVEEAISVFQQRPGVDYEIILVNDGSSDDTFEIIKRLCRNVRIKGINLARNFGQPCASLAGFAHVTGSIIVYSDDDGQTPFDALWSLIDKLNEGHDIVFAKFSQKKNSWIQNMGSKINNIMANYLIGKPKHIHFGNFWVCRRFVIDEAVKCKNPYPYIGGLFAKTTHNMTEVSTGHRERLQGKSNYTFKKMLSLWLNGFTAFSVKPLRIATILGVICSTLGFFYTIFIIFQKIIHPEISAGYTSLMACQLFIGGIIMFMLGLIGEYVGRIYININYLPQYVVRDTMNLSDKKRSTNF